MGAEKNWGDGVDRALYDLQVLGDGWLLAEEAAERALERAINTARESLAERHEEQRRAATRADEERLEAQAHHYQRERAVAEQREDAEWQARIELVRREQTQLKAEAALEAARLAPAPRASRAPVVLGVLMLVGSLGSVAYLKGDDRAGRERLDWARQSASELQRFSAAQEVDRKRLETLTHDLLAQLNQPPKACAPQPAPARPRPRLRSTPSVASAAAAPTAAKAEPPTKAEEARPEIRDDPNDPLGLGALGL